MIGTGGKSLLTLALGLALAGIASAATDDARVRPGSALADLAASSSLLDAWRDYALDSLKPSFSWANDGEVVARAPSLFDRGRSRLTPASRFNGTSNNDSGPLHIAMLSSKVSQTPLFSGASAPDLLPDLSPGFRRYIVAPSLTQRWNESSFVTISAILAYQRLVGFGSDVDFQRQYNPQFAATQFGANETAFGAGVRVDFSNALTDRLAWQVGYQNRVNMDAFTSFRSYFAQPGTFDIPASANVGLVYALTPQLRVNAQVERVMYGQVAPFIGGTLPHNLLNVLTSSVAPTFVWENLDVYSVGGLWHERDIGDFSLRYSTREQPLPTSALLRDALGVTPSNHNVEFAFARAIDEDSSLRLAATWAPTQYVFGMPVNYNLTRNLSANEFQFEALWTTSF
ncbi:MAG TPA: hypothetical protein VF132_06300 [Rudaea sp.]